MCMWLQDIKVLIVLKCKAGNEPYTTLNYIDVRQLTISRKLGAQKQTVILYWQVIRDLSKYYTGISFQF